mgnify:CR=1
IIYFKVLLRNMFHFSSQLARAYFLWGCGSLIFVVYHPPNFHKLTSPRKRTATYAIHAPRSLRKFRSLNKITLGNKIHARVRRELLSSGVWKLLVDEKSS